MRVDRWAGEILARFESRADEIADEIAAATVDEVPGFAHVSDGRLHAEIRDLARSHLDAFLASARLGIPPDPTIVTAARERAAHRAREMVPLTALLHSYLIAQRSITAALACAAGPDARSRGAALELIALTFNYNIAVTSAMAEAYVEVVQGDLADLESARSAFVDALLTTGPDAWPALSRRANRLGYDPERTYVVVAAALDVSAEDGALSPAPRWAAQALARSSGRPERLAFVVTRAEMLIALLEPSSSQQQPRQVLARAAEAMRQSHNTTLRAGVGTPFAGLSGFAASYHEARRALRHTTTSRPFVFAPGDIRLFDELTTSMLAGDGQKLVPPVMWHVLGDETVRTTLEAFVHAELNVGDAARELALHPNSLRYRLRRIGETTGRDPRKLSDLLELIAAARIRAAAAEPRSERELGT
jgi:sugar diacid utilization regulator